MVERLCLATRTDLICSRFKRSPYETLLISPGFFLPFSLCRLLLLRLGLRLGRRLGRLGRLPLPVLPQTACLPFSLFLLLLLLFFYFHFFFFFFRLQLKLCRILPGIQLINLTGCYPDKPIGQLRIRSMQLFRSPPEMDRVTKNRKETTKTSSGNSPETCESN